MWRADLWLALIRVVVGVVVLRNAWPKFAAGWLGGVVPYLTVSAPYASDYQRRLAAHVGNTPFGWHRDFLQQSVLPHAGTAATVHAWAELLVGIGLVLGLLTGLAALVGLVLTLNVSLGTYVPGAGPPAVHWLLPAGMLAFLGSRAGRVWGLDAVIRRKAGTALRVVLAPLT